MQENSGLPSLPHGDEMRYWHASSYCQGSGEYCETRSSASFYYHLRSFVFVLPIWFRFPLPVESEGRVEKAKKRLTSQGSHETRCIRILRSIFVIHHSVGNFPGCDSLPVDPIS